MNNAEFKQGPLLAGWAIAAGVGLTALGVSLVIVKFDLTPAVAIAAVLFLIVGVILGLPQRAPSAVPARQATVIRTGAFSAPAPLMASAAPVVGAASALDAAIVAAPAASAMSGSVTPMWPAAMAAARDGGADDLTQITGVGPVLERLLHSHGVFHFDQVAGWTPAEVAWVDDNLEGFKGRVSREDWVAQAKILLAGGATEFSRRAKGRIEDDEVH